MKKYLKENIKNLPFILVAFIMFYSITTLATNYLFNSNEISYDNTETGLHADEVQGAIDEVFQHATDYSELKNKIGTNALTTTAQTLTGGVNELKTSVTSLNDQIGNVVKSYNANASLQNRSIVTKGKNDAPLTFIGEAGIAYAVRAAGTWYITKLTGTIAISADGNTLKMTPTNKSFIIINQGDNISSVT